MGGHKSASSRSYLQLLCSGETMQVLCLTSPVQEEAFCNEYTPAAESKETKDSDSTHPLQLTSQEIPQKNTFIHFDLHCERPSTPTSSAPGVLLQRLFKLDVQSNDKMQIVEPPTVQSFSSERVDGYVTSICDFENEARQEVPHKHSFVHFDLHQEQ